MDLPGFLQILEHYLGSGNALSAQLDLETKLNNQSLNTVSQKKSSSSGDQFQIFQIFCYGVMGRDGLTTLRPKKVWPDPLAGRPGPL